MFALDRACGLRRCTAIVVLLAAIVICGPAAKSATPAEIKKLIADLAAALPAESEPVDSTWSADAEKLRVQLSKLKLGDPIAATVTRSGELENTFKALAASTNADLRKAVVSLSTAAATIMANEPVLAFTERLARLHDLVMVKTFPSSNPDVQSGLANLKETLAKLDPPPAAQPRIHIVNARYGASRSRNCNATPGLLVACERKVNCTLPAPTSLCGYDPAPTADDASKAAYIEYQCVTGGDDAWAKLGSRDAAVAPGAGVRRAWLRVQTQGLACLQPAL